MLWNKTKITKVTNRVHNKIILVIDHNTPRKIKVSRHLNLRIRDKEADPEASHRETPRPPTHSQAEWE